MDKEQRKLVAKVLRLKLSRGESLTANQMKWLEEYKRTHRPGRPKSRPDFSPSFEPAFTKAGEPEIVSEGESPDAPPPLNFTAPSPPPSEESDEVKAEVVDEEKERESQADEQARQEGIELADKYCDWLKAVNHRISALGGISIPDVIIDNPIRYAAKESFTRAAKVIGENMSERAQDATVVIAAAISYGQEHFLKRRQNAPNPPTNPAEKKASIVPKLVAAMGKAGLGSFEG